MRLIAALLLSILVTVPALAQQRDSPAVQLANLRQDVELLQREVARMRLQMEQLQRDNTQLSNSLSTVSKAQNQLTTSYNSYVQNNAAQLDQLSRTLTAADEKQKEVLIAEFSKRVEALAAQTQKAIDQLANAIDNQPSAMQPAIEFSSNFPRNGIRYTVQRGDTLSAIARQHDSRIKWIQDANKIAKPEALQVGDTIFIPQQD